MTEKLTDRMMLNLFESVFGNVYETKNNVKLFGSKNPDGWYNLNDKTLLIIENKRSISDDKKAQKQVILYAKMAYENDSNINKIFCINGFGVDTLNYYIYEYSKANDFIKIDNITLNDIRDMFGKNNIQNQTDNKTLKSLHELIVKETEIRSTEQLSIFTGFLLLSSTIPSIRKLIISESHVESSLLYNIIISEFSKRYKYNNVIDKYFKDEKLNNVNLFKLLKQISTNSCSMNDLYNRFCKYTKYKTDKNIELTPDYIIEIMHHFTKLYDYTSIVDPFAGTGSLLLNIDSDKEKYCYEIIDYMYLLTLINYEINNVRNYEIFNEDSMKSKFQYDICLTNPPYTKNISGKTAIECLCSLINKVDIIIAIIPSSNLSNGPTFTEFKKRFMDNRYYPRYIVSCGKCFKGIGVEASIIVLEQTDKKLPYKLFDFTLKNKVDYVRPPYCDLELLDPGKRKMLDIFEDKNYVLIENYDENSDWLNNGSLMSTDEICDNMCKTHIENIINLIKNYQNISYIPDKYKDIMNSFNNFIEEQRKIISETEFKPVKIGDIFEEVKKVKNYNYKTTGLPQKPSEYINVPIFGCKKLDNGITGYVEKEEYEGNVLVVVRTRDSTCGYTFHHNGKLAWTSGFCIVIKPKITMSEEILDSFAVQMTMQLAPNHTNSESFNVKELMEKEILVPATIIDE